MSSWFWSEWLWLPPGIKWANVTSFPGWPNASDMYWSPVYALVILADYHRIVARPLGRALGLEDPGSELPNFFKRVYRLCRRWIRKGTSLVSSQSDVKLDDGKRVRTQSGRVIPITIIKTTLDKFCECAWRFAFYSSAFGFGLWTLWDKPWLWDQAECFIGYPFVPVDDQLRWYYLYEASFYWSLMFSQFTDVQRKDFEMMFVHHVATLLLMWFSWNVNYTRMGSLILLIHDAADVPLEMAKMLRYLEQHTLCNVVFAIFTLTWFVTRCGMLPYYVLYPAFVEAPALIVWYPIYYILNSLLAVLQVLHAIWSWMILKALYGVLVSGEVEDIRSDDEEEEE